MKQKLKSFGRVLAAPERARSGHPVAADEPGRRDFLRKALALGGGAAAAGLTAQVAGAEGDPAILKLPAHSTGLGKPVAAQLSNIFNFAFGWERGLGSRTELYGEFSRGVS